MRKQMPKMSYTLSHAALINFVNLCFERSPPALSNAHALRMFLYDFVLFFFFFLFVLNALKKIQNIGLNVSSYFYHFIMWSNCQIIKHTFRLFAHLDVDSLYYKYISGNMFINSHHYCWLFLIIFFLSRLLYVFSFWQFMDLFGDFWINYQIFCLIIQFILQQQQKKMVNTLFYFYFDRIFFSSSFIFSNKS